METTSLQGEYSINNFKKQVYAIKSKNFRNLDSSCTKNQFGDAG